MLAWLVTSSVRFRLLVLPIAAALLILGAVQLHKSRVDVVPEVSPPTVEVQTESLGLSASEVEDLITVPMEHFLLNGIKGVDTIRSDSAPGVSRIDLIFDRGTNLLDARSLVQEQLTRIAALPNVAAPPQMLQPLSSTSRVLMIGLQTKNPKKISPIDLSIIARWIIRPRLLGLQGVANVTIYGQRDRQLQVLVDPQRLKSRGVTLAQIIKTAGNAQLVSPLTYLNASTPGAGGFLDGPNQRLSVRHQLPLGKPGNLAEVPVDGAHGVRLGGLTRVVEGHQPLIGDAVVHGGQGLLLGVDKRPGAGTPEVTRKVLQAFAEMKQGLRGVRVDTNVFKPASYINNSIDHLAVLSLIAFVLVLLGLVAFFLRWRAVLISVIAIPLSLLSAILVLDAFGYTINALVVAGLVMAVGVVVDYAISSTDEIVRRIRERRDANGHESATTIVLDSSIEIRGAIGSATAIVVVTVVPVVIAKGVTATFLDPLVLAYGLAVVAAMVISLTVTPALSTVLFVNGRSTRAEPPIARRLAQGYESLLQRTLQTPRAVLYGLGVVGLVGIVAVPFLEPPDRPTFRDRDLLVRWDATPSTSLPEMDRITTRASAALRSIRGVKDVDADLGRAVTSDRVVGTNSGEIWVRMAGGADYGKTLSQIRQVADGTPGVRGQVSTYEDTKTADVLERPTSAVVVRIYGHDFPLLRQKAHQLRGTLGSINGVRDTRLEGLPVEAPTLRVQVNLADALRHEIKPGDVRRAVATMTSGLTVGNFFEEQAVFDVVVVGVPATRQNVDSVRNLLIDTPSGGTVRVGDVARVSIGPDPVDIQHYATSRFLDLRLDTNGGNTGSVRSEAKRRLKNVAFPLAYHAEVLGGSANGQTSKGHFLAYVIAAEIAVLLLLQAAFGSWSLAFAVFLTLPLATAGGVIVALAGGHGGSLAELAGLIAIVGLTLRPAITFVTRQERVQRQEGGTNARELTLRIARDRFAPTAMAALATALAMLPFAVVGHTAGNEITQPLAEVILGGLVTATLVNLVIVPAICLAWGSTAPERPPEAELAELDAEGNR